MSELRTHSLRHNSATGDANIEMYADGSTSIRNLQNLAKSLVINGAMNVAQRGTSRANVSSANYYCIDRMRHSRNNLGTARFTISQDTESPAGFSHSYKVETTTGQAVGNDSGLRFQYKIEGQDLQHLEWGTANAKSLSVSFWVRSSVAGTYGYHLFRDEATDRNIGTTFTITAAEATNGTWKLITHTFAGDQTTAITDDSESRLELTVNLTAGSDFTATDNTSWGDHASGRSAFGHTAEFSATVGSEFHITGLQITPTDAPIEFQHESYGETLAKCQRYFQSIGEHYMMTRSATGTLYSNAPLEGVVVIPRMRAAPTITANDGVTATITASFSAVDYKSTTQYEVRPITTPGSSSHLLYFRFVQADNGGSALPAQFVIGKTDEDIWLQSEL